MRTKPLAPDRVGGLLLPLVLLSIAPLGCGADPARSDGGAGTTGGGGNGGSSSGGAGGGAGAAGGRVVSPTSGLPVPPGGGVAKPTGTPATVTVLDWAGFKSAVSWTFDDSQPSQLEHYAELQAAGVPMTFYITTNNSGLAGYDATFTKAVADGHEIGNHTVHHCQANLTNCTGPLATLEDEIDQASMYIAQHYPAQGTTWTAASPYGDIGYDVLDSTRFLVNRGVGGGTIAPNDSTDPFNLPIHGGTDGETAGTFNATTDSARASGRWLIILIHTITPTSNNWYAPIAIGEITSAIAHEQSTGDTWIDTVVAIAAYWRAQKLFTGLTPTTSGSGKTWTWTLPAHFPPGKYLRVKTDGGTLTQGGAPLAWDEHGYYEIALDAGTLTLAP